MKINTKALFQVGGIKCVHKTKDASGNEQLNSARLVFICDKTVTSARVFLAQNPGLISASGDPEIQYGSILTVAKLPSGTVGRVLNPGETAEFYLDLGGDLVNITGSNLLSAREAIVSFMKSGGKLDADISRTLSGIQDIFEMVCSAPDTTKFPSNLISQSYLSSMIDAFGPVSLTIDDESFSRKSRADLIKARIGIIDPIHKDALGHSMSLKDILTGWGVPMSSSGVAADLRKPELQSINEEAIKRIVMGDDILKRHVFGLLTTTPIDELSAGMISLGSLAAVREKKKDRLMSGPWIDHVRSMVAESTGSSSPERSLELDMIAEAGRDILLVSDSISSQMGVAFAYSWKTENRSLMIAKRSGNILSVSPEEVPSEEEIARLKSALSEIEVTSFFELEEADQSHLDG